MESSSNVDGKVSIKLVLDDRLVSLDPLTGQVTSSQSLSTLPLPVSELDFLMVKAQNEDVLLAVPKSGEGQVGVLQNEIALEKLTIPPIFFTSVDRVNGKINGHSINMRTMKSENIWKITLGD